MAEEETICQLGDEYTWGFFEAALERSEGAQAIWKELESRGFQAMREEGRLVSAYSPDDKQALAIGLIPFLSDDRTRSAGLSVSQGGFAKAVSVEAEDKVATRFTIYDFFRGDVRVDDFDADRLMNVGAERFAEETEPRRAEKPLVELEQARSITQLVYGGPSGAEYPNAKLASEISALVQLQTVGSPGCSCSSTCGCCCSCCCSCCWS
jgi:hypothetical protein